MAADLNQLMRQALVARRMTFAQQMQAQQAARAQAAAQAQAGTPVVPVAPSPPTLPSQAAQQATTAVTAAPAFAVSLGGHQAPHHEWQYEPQPDRSWKMYPPGVPAPPAAVHASMGRPATPGDLAAMTTKLAELSALPGRRVGQYVHAGLTPPPPPGWANRPPTGGGGGDDGGGDDGGGGDGTGGTGNTTETEAGPYIPGIPTMANPHRGSGG
jgi:hypothetical protein